MRALRALPKLRDPERFPSWILTIAANVVKEIARRRPVAPLEREPPAADRSADEEARSARARAVEEAIGQLDAEERELFLLHTADGAALDELARARGTSVAAMKSRVHRIRAKLRVSAYAALASAGWA